eukprot:gene6215-9224_t
MVGLPALTTEQLDAAAKGNNPLEIIQWLEMLEHSLLNASKEQLQNGTAHVLQILQFLLSTPYGKPVRDRVSQAYAALFDTAGTAKLSKTVNEFLSMIKIKDESPLSYQARLGAVSAMGRLHLKLGNMMFPFMNDVVPTIIKFGKNSS